MRNINKRAENGDALFLRWTLHITLLATGMNYQVLTSWQMLKNVK